MQNKCIFALGYGVGGKRIVDETNAEKIHTTERQADDHLGGGRTSSKRMNPKRRCEDPNSQAFRKSLSGLLRRFLPGFGQESKSKPTAKCPLISAGSPH